MKQEYIVTNEYLSERGLNLNDYVLEGILVNAVINLGLDLLVSRICYLDDDKKGEHDIELVLDNDPNKVNTFYKAQYRVIYGLIFQGETNPVDSLVDSIIVHELGWGKINGFQKGIYYKHN